jgi:hypothetical protein
MMPSTHGFQRTCSPDRGPAFATVAACRSHVTRAHNEHTATEGSSAKLQAFLPARNHPLAHSSPSNLLRRWVRARACDVASVVFRGCSAALLC